MNARKNALLAVALGLGCDSTVGPLFGGDAGDRQSPGFEDFLGDGEAAGETPRACTGASASAELRSLPVDIIIVLDNSASMRDEMEAVEANVNENFSALLEQSEIDYRVIVLSRHRVDERDPSDDDFDPNTSICVERPLSALTACPASAPRLSNRFFHYNVRVSSTNSLETIVDTYDEPDDPFNLAPNGWRQWVREGASKVFLEFTDDESDMSADDFVEELQDVAPQHFGSNAGAPGFVFHSIVGLGQKSPATTPYLPEEPIERDECSGANNEVKNAGETYQELSRLSGGLRFPLCEFGSYDVVFRSIARSVVEGTELACTFDIPPPPRGRTLDLDRVAVSLRGPGVATRELGQARGPRECAADAFYVADGQIRLCDAACQRVRSTPSMTVDVLFTCESTIIVR